MTGSVLLRLLGLGAAWWAVVEGDPTVVGYGLVTVPVAVALSYAVTGRPRPGTPLTPGRFLAAAGLAGWVLWRSVVGGVDVARRALTLPGPDVDPYWRSHTTTLPTPGARAALAFVLNLMPGTVSARLHGDSMDVHVISPDLDVDATIAELERRIALVVPPSPAPPPEGEQD
ncbi:Na+/H+ antiporter subunit E [Xylanimonas oleitrophica]|uniref:Na+/H+ antiporter subunit E n=1 Tax=Xylanimonas oleitrophica TaxID=2607479 RepID=UPI0015D07228|nr:Na+/H+ antiporter subunit E [Xylanimonas oleitrophica]